MNRFVRAAALAAVLAALLAPAAGAQDPNISSLKLGTHVFGPEFEAEDLAGRPVLVYFWDLT